MILHVARELCLILRCEFVLFFSDFKAIFWLLSLCDVAFVASLELGLDPGHTFKDFGLSEVKVGEISDRLYETRIDFAIPDLEDFSTALQSIATGSGVDIFMVCQFILRVFCVKCRRIDMPLLSEAKPYKSYNY